MIKIKKYKMTPLVEKYYLNWLNGPSLLEHPNDQERFYKFIKACLRRSRERKDGAWLKYFLERDLKDKYDEEYFNNVCSQAISIFDHIIDYSNVFIPDHLIEMRNPSYVASELRRIVDENGQKKWTESEIKDYLKEKFGCEN